MDSGLFTMSTIREPRWFAAGLPAYSSAPLVCDGHLSLAFHEKILSWF
jgi:hypothetical protein